MLPIFKVSIKEKEDLQNHLELCPLEEQDGDEQVEMEPLPEFISLCGEAPSLPEARAAKETAPPSEEEAKTHKLTHANYEPWCEHCVAGRGQALEGEGGQSAARHLGCPDGLVVHRGGRLADFTRS